jgi:hypothetical protein
MVRTNMAAPHKPLRLSVKYFLRLNKLGKLISWRQFHTVDNLEDELRLAPVLKPWAECRWNTLLGLCTWTPALCHSPGLLIWAAQNACKVHIKNTTPPCGDKNIPEQSRMFNRDFSIIFKVCNLCKHAILRFIQVRKVLYSLVNISVKTFCA